MMRRAAGVGAVRVPASGGGESPLALVFHLGFFFFFLLGQERLLVVGLHAVELGLLGRYFGLEALNLVVWRISTAGARRAARALLNKRLADRVSGVAAAVRDDDLAILRIGAGALVLGAGRAR